MPETFNHYLAEVRSQQLMRTICVPCEFNGFFCWEVLLSLALFSFLFYCLFAYFNVAAAQKTSQVSRLRTTSLSNFAPQPSIESACALTSNAQSARGLHGLTSSLDFGRRRTNLCRYPQLNTLNQRNMRQAAASAAAEAKRKAAAAAAASRRLVEATAAEAAAAAAARQAREAAAAAASHSHVRRRSESANARPYNTTPFTAPRASNFGASSSSSSQRDHHADQEQKAQTRGGASSSSSIRCENRTKDKHDGHNRSYSEGRG